MKKLLVKLVVFSLLVATSILMFACESPSQVKLEDALKKLQECYALDVDINIEMSNGYTTYNDHTQIKIIASTEEQTAYFSSANQRFYGYYADNCIYETRNGDENVYDSDLDQFKVEYDLPLDSIIINEISQISQISMKKDGNFDVYSMITDDTIKTFINSLFTEIEIEGRISLNIWLERSSQSIKKLEYSFSLLQVTSPDLRYDMKIDFVINALNDDVKIKIPTKVSRKIASYKDFPLLSLNLDPIDGGTLSGAGKIEAGNYVYISAKANNGYRFKGWYHDELLISDRDFFSFIMTDDDLTLTAKFEKATPQSFSVYTDVYPYYYHGYVSSKQENKNEGDIITVSAMPMQYDLFLGWYDDDVLVSDELEYTFTMPANDVFLSAHFATPSINYTDSEDGAVKHYNLTAYQDVIYDKTSEKFIVLRETSADIYDKNMQKKRTLEFVLTAKTIAADQGVLSVGFGNYYRLSFYDLANNSLIETITTEITVDQITMDGDIVFFTGNYATKIAFYKLSSKEMSSISTPSIPNASIALNRNDHILYVTETDENNAALILIDTQICEIITQHNEIQHTNGNIQELASMFPPLFDGEYLHVYGNTFDGLTGSFYSHMNLNKHYNKLTGFSPIRTMYSSSEFDIVMGLTTTSYKLCVYDNTKNEYDYSIPYAALTLEKLSETTFLAQDPSKNIIAIIDLANANKGISGNVQPPQEEQISEEGDAKYLTHFESYSLFASDDNYIYLINDMSFTLTVYDKNTLIKVYQRRYLLKPACLDAAYGKLLIGFGNARQFYIYDTISWTEEKVDAVDNVFSIAFYGGKVYYFSNSYYSNALCAYSLETKKNISVAYIGSFSAPIIAINHEAGIMYIGDAYIYQPCLIYLDLTTFEIIYQSEYSHYPIDNEPLKFDGEFVYYRGYVLDKLTGLIISTTNQARIYEGVGDFDTITTIYDDGQISIFSITMGAVRKTLFYDIAKDEVFLEVENSALMATKTNDGYILFHGAKLITLIKTA